MRTRWEVLVVLLKVADARVAICRHRFAWTGTIDGRPRSGNGRGTNVLVNNHGTWQMLHEHLSA